MAIKKLGDLLGLPESGSQEEAEDLGEEEVAGLVITGNDDAKGPQEAHHDGTGGVSTDPDGGEVISVGHASDGDERLEDPEGPQSKEDNHEARNLPGDEQSIRGESRASHGLEVMQGAPGTGKLRGVLEIDAFSGVVELGPGPTAGGFPLQQVDGAASEDLPDFPADKLGGDRVVGVKEER